MIDSFIDTFFDSLLDFKFFNHKMEKFQGQRNGNTIAERKESSVLEKTIANMELSMTCIHPIHYHSFELVSFLLSGPMRLCAGCNNRLKSLMGATGSDHIVRCLACGVYAHRACAKNDDETNAIWHNRCVVNSALINNKEGENDEDTIPSSCSFETRTSPLDTEVKSNTLQSSAIKHKQKPFRVEHGMRMNDSMLPLTNILTTVLNVLSWNDIKNNKVVDKKETALQLERSFVWTDEGPPQHWASDDFMISLTTEDEEDAIEAPGTVVIPTPDHEERNNTLTSNGESTFLSISRALQENILSHFQKEWSSKIDYQVQVHGDEIAEALVSGSDDDDDNILDNRDVKRYIARPPIKNDKSEAEALLTELELGKPQNSISILEMANGTYEAAKTTVNFRKKLGYASVAGGIAGGVAGLFVAGPAGLVMGAKCGQTVGFLGVALEGTYAVGVVVVGFAGAAAAGFTVAHKLQHLHNKRVLTIGEKDSKRKVLLVRPNVWIDPEWDAITANAKQSVPSSGSSLLGMLSSSPSKQADFARQQRSKRDADIVQTDEFEIPTEDKILLLVSRSLNCRHTVPGHVYRSLIQEHRKRSDRRILKKESMSSSQSKINAASSKRRIMAELSKETFRARREDTHAVIKHVTATLLEIKPGFSHSARITEMSAVAVESLVFGELYDCVIAEIIEEMKPADDTLMAKIKEFERNHEVADVAEDAIKALHQIPEAHSVAEKMRHCVAFLERIADHFDGANLSADSLLKMVCQQICVAKVPSLNAEIAFLEEFARDDQLLNGKEGYALVTLQASLHFLNASIDFEKDIFHDD